MRRVVTWLLVVAGIWVLWAGALFLGQRRLIFPRHVLNPVTDGTTAPPGAERLVLEGASGPGLAWYLPPASGETPERARGAAPAVIFAHGNAEVARDWAAAYRSLAREGVAVLLVEYPGYGGAPGSPSRASIRDVMVAAWDALASRPEVDRARIVGLGRSLGGGAVTELARHRPLAGLVLQSSFTRVRDFAPRMLVPPFLIRDPFDNVSAVASFDGPVLVFHGREDGVIPYAHGVAVAASSERAELVTWECAHNDCPPDWTSWIARISAFVHGLEPVPTRPDSGIGKG